MEKCIITGKIYSNENKQCKVWKLDECREVIEIIEDEQKYVDESDLERLKRQLPELCRNRSFLVVTNLRKQKVYCPYLVKKQCLI